MQAAVAEHLSQSHTGSGTASHESVHNIAQLRAPCECGMAFNDWLVEAGPHVLMSTDDSLLDRLLGHNEGMHGSY